jgi:sugar lactone lactonase YvrE
MVEERQRSTGGTMDGSHPPLKSALGLFREPTSAAAESVWWDPSGGLYWCDPEAGTIHFSALGLPVSGADDGVIKLPPLLAAFAPAPGGFVIAGKNAVALVGPTGAFLRTLARIPHKTEQIRFNEAKCDPYGLFVVGTSGVEGFANGTIYSVDPAGEWRVMYEHAGLVTGMQWSDDGSRMWFMDTKLSTIFTCEYSGYGDMKNVQPFVRGIRGEGLARDADGGFWTSFEGGGKIARWDATGRQTLELAIPTKRVTSVTFGGTELTTLFIATSRAGLSGYDISTQPLAGGIFGIETATHGFPTRPFGLP